MDQSKFVSDQREICLDAIRRIEPNFNPVYKPPAFTYSNKLLHSLNDNVVPIEKVIDNSVSTKLSMEKYVPLLNSFSFSTLQPTHSPVVKYCTPNKVLLKMN